MAAPAIDHNEPTFSSAVDEAQDQIRDNIDWIVIALGNAGIIIPGWAAVPSGGSPAKPSRVVLTGPGSRKIRMTYTYTGNNVTGIDIDYNSGSGYEQVALGTATITYDGSGNWTGATWA